MAFPARFAIIETDSSGLDVAKTATVAPIMPGDILAECAMPTEPRTNISPPMPAHRIPAIRKM